MSGEMGGGGGVVGGGEGAKSADGRELCEARVSGGILTANI